MHEERREHCGLRKQCAPRPEGGSGSRLLKHSEEAGVTGAEGLRRDGSSTCGGTRKERPSFRGVISILNVMKNWHENILSSTELKTLTNKKPIFTSDFQYSF